jgi:hypothetical protein
MKSARWQFLVRVDGIDGYWAGKTGGNIAADANKAWDGGARRPDVLGGRPNTEDVELTRPYDPIRDQPWMNALKSRVGEWRTTLSTQPLNADMTAVNISGDVYSDALLINLSPPEVDASSSDPAEVGLTFAVSAVG